MAPITSTSRGGTSDDVCSGSVHSLTHSWLASYAGIFELLESNSRIHGARLSRLLLRSLLAFVVAFVVAVACAVALSHCRTVALSHCLLRSRCLLRLALCTCLCWLGCSLAGVLAVVSARGDGD